MGGREWRVGLHWCSLPSPEAKALNVEWVRFEIHGDDDRLIVAINFRMCIAFVKLIGTHAEPNRIDASTRLTVSQPGVVRNGNAGCPSLLGPGQMSGTGQHTMAPLILPPGLLRSQSSRHLR
ncbi:type II toxin-antitoxin system HigB family toxin [Xanthobacter flavus]|uniref:type II toxin-antitoxin system HigB family toxin n=1 Tax=Xanthobacter flavus TaxID=281 RepID=UPI003727EB68